MSLEIEVSACDGSPQVWVAILVGLLAACLSCGAAYLLVRRMVAQVRADVSRVLAAVEVLSRLFVSCGQCGTTYRLADAPDKFTRLTNGAWACDQCVGRHAGKG